MDELQNGNISTPPQANPQMDFGEMIIYQSEEGIKLDVRLENKTVWLNIEQIALLFNKGRTTISGHISNIFKEGELEESVVCRKFRHTTQHGAIGGYHLDCVKCYTIVMVSSFQKISCTSSASHFFYYLSI